MIGFVVVFGVLGAGIGLPVGGIAIEMGAFGSGGRDVRVVFGHQMSLDHNNWYALLLGITFMGGVLGAALGGFVGYRINRSEDK